MKIKTWATFIKERFDPVSHSIMIFLFVTTHSFVAQSMASNKIDILNQLMLLITSFFFFLKLRMYDEIKDYDFDIKFNPSRPLPRGLLSIRDLKIGITFCILIEILTFLIVSKNAFLIFSLTIIYSLLMFKEFFIGKLIRPHLTTYALSHTLVTVGLSLSLITGFLDISFDQITSDMLNYALVSWFLFNIFEFGRKTYLPSEERNGVDSYSKIFKPQGALILNLSQCILASYFLFQTSLISNFLILFIILSIVIFAFTGLLYIKSSKLYWGKIYRGLSSGFIIIFYIVITLNYFIKS